MGTNEKIKNFRDLRVWQKGIELVKGIYKITNKFSTDEQYGLSSQMRRPAVSIPVNIAEGFRRKYNNKEYKQFLNIALESAAELETQLIIPIELRYINKKEGQTLIKLIDYIYRMIVNLNKKTMLTQYPRDNTQY